MFITREKVLNSFKRRLFPIESLDKFPTREPTPEAATETIAAAKATKPKAKRKISLLKLGEEFLDKIKSEEKNINKQIFKDYFLLGHIIFRKMFI